MKLFFLLFLFEGNQNKGDKQMSETIAKLNGKTAEQILNEYRHKKTLPIDITEIAENIGINLGSIDFKELEDDRDFKDLAGVQADILGAVYINDNSVQILYDKSYRDLENSSLTEEEKKKKILNRQRFTIAHEIAHCCLHLKPNDVAHIQFRTDQTDITKEEEVEANIFAGKLLIPTNIISELCSVLDRYPISALANAFSVSYHVMYARLEHLIDTGIIKRKEFV